MVMSDDPENDVPEVIMYSQALCGYCAAARKLLKRKGVDFTEINVTLDAAKRREMINRSGRSSVPQIFIDNRHIGGYDDMAELDRRNELDALLGTT